MKTILKTIFPAFLFTVFSISYAQDAKKSHLGAWTLEDCMDYALEHSIKVKQQVVTVQQSNLELSDSKLSRLPKFSGQVSENLSFGRGLTAANTYSNTNTTTTSLNLGGDIPIFQGMRINNDIEAKKLNLLASVADLEKTKDDLRLAVARAFMEILYDEEILETAKQQVSIDSIQVERLKVLVATGKGTQVQLAQQLAALSQSNLSLTQANSNLQLALLELTQLLELPSPEGFEVVRPNANEDILKIIEKPEDIYYSALGTMPSILVEKYRLNASKMNIKVAKGAFYPTLSLSGGIGTNYYTNSSGASKPFFDQLKSNFSQFIGLSLNIPIFNKMATRNNVKKMQLLYAKQELQIDNASKALFKEIQQAYYNAVTAQAKFVGSSDACDSAKESFELLSSKYESGKANITEFNEAKTAYIKAKAELSRARYQYLYGVKVLDFYKERRFEL